MNVKLTRHSQDRVSSRLAGLVTIQEVYNQVGTKNLPKGDNVLVLIKKMKYTEINDPSVKPDGVARGDMLVAACDTRFGEAVVKTVLLRKSWSKSTQYAEIIGG